MKKLLSVATMLMITLLLAAGLFACTKRDSYTLTAAEVSKAYTDAGFTVAANSAITADGLLQAYIVTKTDSSSSLSACVIIFKNSDAMSAYNQGKSYTSGTQNVLIITMMANGAPITNLNDNNAIAIAKPVKDLADSKK